MPDYGSRITEKAMADMAKKFRKVYDQAVRDLSKKLLLFCARYKLKQKQM